MPKKIKTEEISKIEMAYRVCVITTYMFVVMMIVSFIIASRVMSINKNSVPVTIISIAFAIYTIMTIACSILAILYYRKTKKEFAVVHSIALAFAAAFDILNSKMFYVLFLYGIGKDSKASEIVGNDASSFVDNFQSNWTYLIVGFCIVMFIAIFSLRRIMRNK